MNRETYSYERDKKFGDSSTIEYKDASGKTIEECIGCLSYHASLLLYWPDSEEFIENYTDDYNEYIRIIREGIYPVDGYYSEVYQEIKS